MSKMKRYLDTFFEENVDLNEPKKPEVGIGIFKIFTTSDLFELLAFLNSKAFLSWFILVRAKYV
jgi:hypothetical protein